LENNGPCGVLLSFHSFFDQAVARHIFVGYEERGSVRATILSNDIFAHCKNRQHLGIWEIILKKEYTTK
jgi:hypothetical protein